MKCDFSSTSSKSCVISNKTTSVSFGGKKAKKLLPQGTSFLGCFSQRTDTSKFAAIFSYFQIPSQITWGKKKVGAIRSIPWYSIFKNILHVYLQVYRKVNKFETGLRNKSCFVLIQF